jgi:hypothetical protein
VRKVIFWASLLCFSCVPIPLFFDLSGLVFVLQEASFPEAIAPVPVGLFAVSFVFFLYFFGSFVYPDSYTRFVGLSVSLVGFFVFVVLMCWSLFLSGASFLRALQVYIPLLLLSFISYPTGFFERKLVFWVTLGSISLFVFLHLFSIFFFAENWLVTTSYEFAMFYGFGIYQSLVTYTAVISLYIVVALGAILSVRVGLVCRFGLMLIVLQMLLVLALGARRASIVELIMIASIAAVFAVAYLLVKVRFSIGGVVLFAMALFLFSIVDLISSLPVFRRLAESYSSSTLDSGRFEIYGRAIRELSSDYILLLGGRGAASGYHNFALDLVYSIGLVPLLIFLVAVIAIFAKGLKRMRHEVRKSSWSSLFLFLSVIACFFVQSMVNASVTQPYYLANLLVVVLLLYFMPNRASGGVGSS